jgi:hypothetical protein
MVFWNRRKATRPKSEEMKKFCGGQTASKREFVLSREFLFSDIPDKNGFCGRIKQASNRAEKLSRSRINNPFAAGYR